MDEGLTRARQPFGSPGGGSRRISSAAARALGGLDMTHPFQGGGALVTDLIGGHIPLAISPLTDYIEPTPRRALRLIATSGAVRLRGHPDVPTLAEQGYEDGQATLCFAFWAPPNTPAAVVARRNAEIQKILQMDDVREWLLQLGQRTVASKRGCG